MHDTFRLGRIAGVGLGLNWSWLLIFALIVWTLASNVFPTADPGLGGAAYVGMAVAAALLFFVSLFLHELGHAVQARREGMEIDGITLWVFGGVARFKGSFPSAGAEFRVAVAGPVVTAVLAGAFVGFALLTHVPNAVDGVAAWLGYINVLLLVFNLIPALPLDGGRVFRALLWRAKGEYLGATRVAVAVARVFGYLMMAGGAALFVVQGALSGAWLVFIGWFLLAAVGSEARFAAVRRALGGLTVGDLMTRSPVTARSDETLGEFVEEAAWEGRHSVYPVVEGDRFAGLLAESAVEAVPSWEREVRRVGSAMLPPSDVTTLAESDEAAEAFSTLSEAPLRRAPVLAGARLVGFLSLTDVTRVLGEDGGAPRRRRAAGPQISSRRRKAA